MKWFKNSKPQKKQKFIEGVHFYYNDTGLMVMTAKYHLDRGYCCGNSCIHCPYNGKEDEKQNESSNLT